MGLRTVDQYLAGLADGREVYFHGRRIPDVTADPDIMASARHASTDYALQWEEGHRALAVVHDEELGEEISRYYSIPRTAEDLLKRRELIESGTRRADSLIPFLKDIGSDAIFTLSMVAPLVDAEAGTSYAARVAAYRRHVAKHDLSIAGAITDVKGDRARRPSEQADPDLYVHIVERRPNGIVVKGAKVHTTSGPVVDELIVTPTRALGAEDADYAVAFAVPVATPGVKLLSRTEKLADPFDYPISGRRYLLETLTIFDNVFVPWERVFMAGEWRYAGMAANNFATWHRFTALSYKTPAAELMLGTALLLAEMNGIERASHIRRNLTELAIYIQTSRALGRAAALDCVMDPAGIAFPNPLVANVGKLYFAERFHDIHKAVQEIAGGLMVTAPSGADARDEVTGPLIDKYLAGANGWKGIDRTKVMKLARDLTASDFGGLSQVATIHAEGSLEAQKLTIFRETELVEFMNYAKRVSGVGEPAAKASR